jgi:hypothetical protein
MVSGMRSGEATKGFELRKMVLLFLEMMLSWKLKGASRDWIRGF